MDKNAQIAKIKNNTELFQSVEQAIIINPAAPQPAAFVT